MVIGDFEREFRLQRPDERMVEAVPVADNGGDRKSTSFKAMQAMTEAVPIAPQGGKRENQSVVNTLKPTRGTTNADYLAARIKRDRPDIAQRVERRSDVQPDCTHDSSLFDDADAVRPYSMLELGNHGIALFPKLNEKPGHLGDSCFVQKDVPRNLGAHLFAGTGDGAVSLRHGTTTATVEFGSASPVEFEKFTRVCRPALRQATKVMQNNAGK